MFYVVKLSVWAEDRHAKGTPAATLTEALEIATDGVDPDVIVDETGELACIAGEALGAGACGCPACDPQPDPWSMAVRDLLDDPVAEWPAPFPGLADQVKAQIRRALPEIHDEASLRAALAGLLEPELVELLVASASRPWGSS